MHVSDCPSNEILQALLLGQLHNDESRSYESHIIGCEACGVRTREIQASDPLLDLLPDVRKVDWSAAEEEQARQLVERFSNRSKLLASTAQGGATILTAQIDAAESSEEEAVANVLTQSSISPSEPTSVPVTRGGSASSGDSHHTLVLHPAAGVTLGAYRLDTKLGEGGMGAVWKAFHTRLKKPVALKVLSARVLRDAALVARFEREMEAVGKLDHPAIVRAMDAGEIDGTHYLVMEYVEGTDFGELVKTKGARTVRDACEMIRQAAVGLAYAHKNKLIHRDIKPSNLFLTNEGKVKVLDLGLARLQGDGLAGDPGAGLTSTGQILGTPDYMSPEQWENTHTVGTACDLYALGCTLFFLLTGRAPFADDKHATLPKKMLGHCEHVPPPLSATRAGLLEKVRKHSTAATGSEARRPSAHDIPPELEAIYDKLMAKDPAARFATADQLAAALAEIIKAKPPAPAPASPAPAPPLRAARAMEKLSAPVKGASVPPAPPEPTASATQNAPSEPPTRHLRKLLLGFGGLAASLLFGVIIITIKNKDGTVTKLKVDDSAEISMSRKGNSGTPTSASVTQPSTLNPQPAVWHGWPADAPKPAIAPFDAAQAKRHQEEWAKYLNVPVEYTSPIGTTFRLIPPGEFLMGCTAEDVERILGQIQRSKYADESVRSSGPRHAVTLTRPFYLGTFEVTQAQYARVMNQNPAFFSASGGGKKTVDGQTTSDYPVESVPWHDAERFCSKAGGVMSAGLPVSVQSPPFDSQSVRLPTEAEWEFACRAGTTTRFWSGDDEDQLKKFAWVGPEEHAGWAPHTVGTRPPNPFGLCDMHGNVYEWVQDSWQPDFYETFRDRPAVDPLASGADQPHVARGGWIDIAPYAESSVRNAIGRNTAESWIGLRVALSIDSVRQALNVTGPTIPQVNLAEKGATPASPRPGGHKWATGAPKPAIAPFDAAQAKKHQEEWAAYLKVPVEYTNSIGMKFRLVPPGEFLMGTEPGEIERLAALARAGNQKQEELVIRTEGPQHKVTLTQPTYVGIHEVSQSSFDRIMGKNPSHFRSKSNGLDSPGGAGHQPAESLTWTECDEFCRKLSAEEFREQTDEGEKPRPPYQLLTEAEWEFACRAGTTSRFASGDTDTNLAELGWNRNTSGDHPHASGLKQANAFGLFDMHGNVWEWCRDGVDLLGYGGSPSIDPWNQPVEKSNRIARGGGYGNSSVFSRSAVRNSLPDSSRFPFVGFRIALRVDAVRLALRSTMTESARLASSWHGWPADAPMPAIAPFDAAQAKKHQENWAAYLKVPVEYTNSIGMKLRLIPPGEFLMGSTPEEIERSLGEFSNLTDHLKICMRSEGPRHRVVLTKPFYLGTYEVTQQQFIDVTTRNPSYLVSVGDAKAVVERTGFKDPATLPVEQVGWHDGVEFANTLSRVESLQPSYAQSPEKTSLLESNGYRLPTEAEWEFACRAGTESRYWSGNELSDLDGVAWHNLNSGGTVHPVGQLRPNPFGLYDVHGNVVEWTNDSWDPAYFRQFENSVAIDPQGAVGSEFPVEGRTAGETRLIRGGCMFNPPQFSRSGNRPANFVELRYPNSGFRIAISIDGVRKALKAEPPDPAVRPTDSPTVPGQDAPPNEADAKP